MQYELQTGSFWKRIAAAIFDLILIVILSTGFLWAGNVITDYDAQSDNLYRIIEEYAAEYGVRTDLTVEEYQGMTEQERQDYDAAAKKADAALMENPEAMRLYSIVTNLMLILPAVSILLAMALTEFVVPLFLKNGQTLGKKIFGLCLVRKDCVKISTVQLFARAILAKYALGTMIPVFCFIMLMMGNLGSILMLMVMALLLVQTICLLMTKEHRAIADLLTGTVVVDYSSQMIFETTEDLIEHQKKTAAEAASRQPY